MTLPINNQANLTNLFMLSCSMVIKSLFNSPTQGAFMEEARRKTIEELLSNPFFNISSVSDKALLLYDQSLTHRSYAKEMQDKNIECLDNERLEFFGNFVLGFVVSEFLFKNFNYSWNLGFILGLLSGYLWAFSLNEYLTMTISWFLSFLLIPFSFLLKNDSELDILTENASLNNSSNNQSKSNSNHSMVIYPILFSWLALFTYTMSKALVSSESMLKMDHGFVAKTQRVLMPRGLYPKMWRSNQ